jgi:hypothetical protein
MGMLVVLKGKREMVTEWKVSMMVCGQWFHSSWERLEAANEFARWAFEWGKPVYMRRVEG